MTDPSGGRPRQPPPWASRAPVPGPLPERTGFAQSSAQPSRHQATWDYGFQPPLARTGWVADPSAPLVPAGLEPSTSTAVADRRLMIVGGACVAASVASVILRQAGVLPSGLSTVLVVLVMAIGLRVFLRYAARSASSVHRARVTKIVSLAGLGVALLTLFGSLPRLLSGGGANDFVANVVAHLWTLVILIAIVGTARTLNWLALVGMGLTGLLGVTGLAFAVGRPVVNALGTNSAFATAVFVPFSEELLKALPVLLILFFATRRAAARPSAVEIALVGAVIGSGFALYEDAQYHRGGFHFGAMPVASILNPTASNDSALHITYSGAGHMVYTMLIAFGLAVTFLYHRRFRWAKFAAPVAVVVALLEHCTQNYAGLVASHRGSEGLFDLLRVMTLWGWLSTLLLITGIAVLAREERRATGEGARLTDSLASSFWLKPLAAQRAASALAQLQVGTAR